MKNVKDLCIVAVLIALGVVLSAFLQIPIYSNIKIDLSYIVIIVICYMYGAVVGGLGAMTIAMLESSLFTSLGFSISWTVANLFVGLVCGLTFSLTRHRNIKEVYKHIVNAVAIVLSVAVAMLFIKTGIECVLYEIPFEIKIAKNAVAFGLDVTVCLIGYAIMLPKLIRMNLYKLNEDLREEENVRIVENSASIDSNHIEC